MVYCVRAVCTHILKYVMKISLWRLLSTWMNRMEQLRRQVIAAFDGILIDMNYLLCLPSIHATCQDEEIIVSYNGGIIKTSEMFPKEKVELIQR